jgi:hypothetical protein
VIDDGFKTARERARRLGVSTKASTLASGPIRAEERQVVRDLLHGLGRGSPEVRVRRDAATAADQGAQAFTSGADIVLGASAPTLDDPEGRRLLAHELVHVLQFHEARRQGQTPSGRSRASDPAERQADHMADDLVRGADASEHVLVPASAAVHAQDFSPAEPMTAYLPDEAQLATQLQALDPGARTAEVTRYRDEVAQTWQRAGAAGLLPMLERVRARVSDARRRPADG